MQLSKNFRGGGGIDKIKLLHTKKNSGAAGGTPRNVGTRISRGEYIFYLDSDDAIIPTALEELYTVAKKFDADIVHCEKYFQVATEENLLGRNDYQVTSYNVKKFVTEPTLLSENFADRVNALHNREFMWNVWTKLVRRDFIQENNILMADVALGEDVIFTICVACSAKKYLRVPNCVTVYRLLENSTSHKKEDWKKTFHRWAEGFCLGFEYLDKFLSEFEFFQQNPNAKFVVFDVVANDFIQNYLLGMYLQVPADQFVDLIWTEFEKLANKKTVLAVLFNRMNVFNIHLLQQQNQIQQLQTQLANQS